MIFCQVIFDALQTFYVKEAFYSGCSWKRNNCFNPSCLNMVADEGKTVVLYCVKPSFKKKTNPGSQQSKLVLPKKTSKCRLLVKTDQLLPTLENKYTLNAREKHELWKSVVHNTGPQRNKCEATDRSSFSTEALWLSIRNLKETMKF